MVLDTSVLISDPDSITAFPDADAVIPLVVVEELDQHKSRMDDVGRAARAVIRVIEELRIANDGDIRRAGAAAQRRHAAHRDERPPPQRDPRARPRPDQERQPHPRRVLGQAVHGRTVVVSNDAALRIKAAQLGLEAMEHQRLRGRTAFERPVGWTTIEVSRRDRRPALRQPVGHRHRRARPARRRHSSGRSSSIATPCCGRAPVGAGAPRRRRARAAAARARAVGPAAAVEGAAVRPRPPARPRGAGRRPRRHGRHRQDDPRPGRRARAGDGVEPLRQGRRVPTGRAGGQGRARVPARARSTRSSTRG